MEKDIYINKEIANFHIPRWNELPNIDLYIDQVICFLDDSLSKYVNKEKDGHVLTKTMINNYVKCSIIEPTKNKKYNKEHISNLFIICILKQIYTISDIGKIIKLLTQKDTIDKAYDLFCSELENSISIIFAGKEQSESKEITYDKYILRNVIMSFVNKLYVDKVFLKNI